MPEIPEVPWRFSERYLATDFVQSKNVAISEKANELCPRTTNDDFVEAVATWIRDSFYYPLDNAGNPAAQGQVLRHQKGFMSYHFKKCVYYAWSLPNEVLDATLCGICVDTANLAGSVLRARAIENAWVTLGDVNSTKDGSLLGRHAWIEVPYYGAPYVMETTIHEADVKNLIKASGVYNKESEWAQKSGLYYSVQAKYNESEFQGEGPLGASMVWLMGLPAKRVLLFGAVDAWHQFEDKPKKLLKEWRIEERQKERMLLEAYRRMV